MSTSVGPCRKTRARRAARALRALAVAATLASTTPLGHAEQPTTMPGLPGKAVEAFDALFGGPHKGARAVHAKGILCAGRFVPTAAARELSVAEHFAGEGTPVLVRFSNFSGVPNAADNDPMASPRGMAIKFQLAAGGDTDIVAHSYNGFPAATPTDFVAFLTAAGSSDPAVLQSFVDTHPAARAFLDDPKPAPASYGTERFFGVNAFRFANAAGAVRYGRYRLAPLAGEAHLSLAASAARAPDYLSADLTDRLAKGPVGFRLEVQIASPQDATTDGSIPWPEDRPVVELGTLTLTSLVADGEAIQRTILFTPLNLVEGILPSDDPMLTARSRSYRISHMRRSEQAAAASP